MSRTSRSTVSRTPRFSVSRTPRLSIGLPVYNGERYLAESLDALLDQTFGDFELIISDNASTDATAEICRRYAATDARIRYYRQSSNIGAAPNHNFVFQWARGEYFKWASSDDLYAPTLLERCIAVLDRRPDVVLVHSLEAFADEDGATGPTVPYGLLSSSERLPERFRSMLFDVGGDDMYGVMRSSALRRTRLIGSHHHADRTLTAELVMQGPFAQVPETLYFRRDHPGRAERIAVTSRMRAANMDPRRASRLRHPALRLMGEYVWAYVRMIRRTSMSFADRWRCYRTLAAWLAKRCAPGSVDGRSDSPDPAVRAKASTTRAERKQTVDR
jgi:glycosyltransferase involved in cell wall biosynthesis